MNERTSDQLTTPVPFDVLAIEGKAVALRALDIWRQRELGFPPRVRRLHPDVLDLLSGAWNCVYQQAASELAGELAHDEQCSDRRK